MTSIYLYANNNTILADIVGGAGGDEPEFGAGGNDHGDSKAIGTLAKHGGETVGIFKLLDTVRPVNPQAVVQGFAAAPAKGGFEKPRGLAKGFNAALGQFRDDLTAVRIDD